MSSDYKYCLRLKVEATVELGHTSRTGNQKQTWQSKSKSMFKVSDFVRIQVHPLKGKRTIEKVLNEL